MKRSLIVFVLSMSLACQLPAERLPRPIPEDSGPLPYAELLTRARAQAKVMTESFYVDKWADLEDAARGLEQTARFLERAEDIPETHKQTLPALCSSLLKDTGKLREAAAVKNIDEVSRTMSQINIEVRQMRLSKDYMPKAGTTPPEKKQ